jgi:hypothetical protein
MILSLAPAETMFWQIILIVAAVVLVAVIALLGLLLSLVGSIQTSVHELGTVADGVAGNTAHIKVALAVIDSLDEVADEAGRHAALLRVGV